MVPFKTPPDDDPSPLYTGQHVAKRARPLVIWAGRFDKQKRFDVVCRVAQKMPHVDFHAWGMAVLDADKSMPAIPMNMKVSPPYKSFDELPLNEASCWLYTSGWDGIPTILIELGARGMPVVASDVGGVDELIGPESGWLVADKADVADYVAALSEAISSPELSKKKGQALKSAVDQKHSRELYVKTLNSLMKSHQ
jgi:glycosyltransferase involved in cell wall biosynthesis